MLKFLAVLFVFLSSALSNATGSADCTSQSIRLNARHIEGKGIGYKDGYTTLGGFLSFQRDLNATWYPFIDLRGHIFNDGRFAANGGLGLRYLNSRVWGINTFYDYRNTKRKNFNQISLGLESLGANCDFRLNGYLPIGEKKSSFYDDKFHRFKGHHLILLSKRSFALKSANGEIGTYIKRHKRVSLYSAAGPYYLNGEGKSSWGGKGRLVLDLYNYVQLRVNLSYDSIFHAIAQGEIGVTIPLGKRIKERKNCSCTSSLPLSRSVMQRVDRNEIIPINEQHVKTLAINPKTGDPYFFWFVNNTSRSNGTFESPFSMLINAQNISNINDIIYVYPGDGTSAGMEEGIALKNDQKLLGAGINHRLLTTRGTITIPPLARGLPLIINPLSEIITLANNNEIAGIHIRSFDNKGFFCSGIKNASIHDNQIFTFSDTFPTLTGPVYLDEASGLIKINNNTFLLDNSTLGGPIFGVRIITAEEGAEYRITNNTFNSIPGSSATAIEFGNRFSVPISGNFCSIDILDNTFRDIGNSTAGKVIGGAGFTGSGHLNIQRNHFIRTGASSFGPSEIVYIRVRDSGNLTARVTDNIWEASVTPTKSSFEIINVSASASACVTLSGNRSDNAPIAYELNNTIGGTMIVDVGNNIGTVVEIGTTSGTCPNH